MSFPHPSLLFWAFALQKGRGGGDETGEGGGAGAGDVTFIAGTHWPRVSGLLFPLLGVVVPPVLKSILVGLYNLLLR